MKKRIAMGWVLAVLVVLSAGAAELETAKWQKAIDAASARGGGRVTVPAGRHLVGQLDLKNGVELHLEKGAVLEGAVGLEHYRTTTLTCSEGTWSAVVFALNATNVAVTGKGTIFGNGRGWPNPPKDYAGCQEGLRARGLFFGDCKGVRLEDFTLRDAACWGIVLKRTEDVVARRVKVDSHANNNNDGFDIEARNVLIEDCDVDSGDDAYCVKSNDPDFIVENVTVRRCVGRSQCNVFKIGTASHGIIRKVTFENCRTEATRRDFPGLYPEYPGKDHFFWRVTKRAPFGVANSAIAVECVDGGLLEDVHYNGITIENGAKVPIFVRGGTRTGRKTGARVGSWHILRNVLIENVKGEADGCVASSISGVDGCRAKNITLRNINLVCHGAGKEKSEEAMSEPVPYLPGSYPDAVTSFKTHILPAYGLYVDRADAVTLENAKFTLAKGDADSRPAVYDTATDAACGIDIVQDHPDALYRVGETARFTVTVTNSATGRIVTYGKARWKLDNFASRTIDSGEVDLSDGKSFVVTGKLDQPGFLRLYVSCGGEWKIWGVGFDVEKIRQCAPRPKDFDDYWAGEVARLAKEVPLDPRCEADAKLSNKDFDIFRISFATFAGKRVYGFLSVPKDGAAPYGVHVDVPGAGPGYVTAPCRKGWITIVMNVHTFEPGATYEEQKKRMQAAHAEFAKKFGYSGSDTYCALMGIGDSRETYLFHDVLLGINRAVDWACARPDADRTRVSYTGSSQGGAFGLFLSYLNRNIRRARVAVPAMTGHSLSEQGECDSWPRLVSKQPAAKRAAAARNAAYFDAVNFAAGIRIPIRFIVGLSDTTCPPYGVYAAYNACPSPDKGICNAIGSPHSWFSNPQAVEAERENEWFLGFTDKDPSRQYPRVDHGAPRYIPWSTLLSQIRRDDRRFSFRFFGELPEGVGSGDCEVVITGDGWANGLRAPLTREEMFFTLPAGTDAGIMRVEVVRRSDGTKVHSKNHRYRVTDVPSGRYAGQRRRLNNYVTELLAAKMPGEGRSAEFGFERNVHGWVYIRVTGAKSAEVVLDGRAVITSANPRLETVRLVGRGDHRLVAKGAGQLVVREIPAILDYPPYERKVAAGERYDWEFQKRYVLPGITTFNAFVPTEEQSKYLRGLGYSWLANVRTYFTEAAQIYKNLDEAKGLYHPLCDGITLDEQAFRKDGDWRNDQYNMPFLKALEDYTLKKDTGREVCTWIINQPYDRAFDRELIAACLNAARGTGYILNECYLGTEPSEKAARETIEDRIRILQAYRAAHPRCQEAMGVAFGNFTSLLGLSLMYNPEVDYKAYLAMQVHAFATDPRCDGLRATGYWGSMHADDDLHRLSFRLMRHYCIEGRTDSLVEKYGLRYMPAHIRNGDFDIDFAGWRRQGDIVRDQVKDFGYYSETRHESNKLGGAGDRFAEFRRGSSPNRLSQKVLNLTPGRTYSLRYATFDVDDAVQKRFAPKEIPLEAKLGAGLRAVPGLSWHYVDTDTKFNYRPRHSAIINLHQVVFVAEKGESEVAFTDEKASVGDRLGLNFVCINPYLAAEEFH